MAGVMNPIERLWCKYALEVLREVGAGLPEKPWLDQVSRMLPRPLASLERKRIVWILAEDREWVESFRNSLTGEICYSVTEAGRTVSYGL